MDEYCRSKQLIVIVSNDLSVNNDLAYETYRLAVQQCSSVLYLAIVNEENEFPEMRRNMATMKAITSDNKIHVEVVFTDKKNWFEKLRTHLNGNDIILCQEEQSVSTGLLSKTPLSSYLSSRLDLPIKVLSGFSNPGRTAIRYHLKHLIGVFGFLAIIGLFLWLQVSLNLAFEGVTEKIHLILSFLIEIGAIWSWNKLMYQ